MRLFPASMARIEDGEKDLFIVMGLRQRVVAETSGR